MNMKQPHTRKMLTARDSESKLPRVRPCMNCNEARTIVARGLCDKCRKQGERNELKLVAGPGNRKKQLNGHKALAALEKLLNDMGVLRANRQRMLAEFLPFCGFSPDTARLLLRDMTSEPDAAPQGDDFKVHPGSSMSPNGNEIRTPETDEDAWLDGQESVQPSTLQAGV